MTSNWITVTSDSPAFEILNASPGEYEFEVVATGAAGSTTAPARATKVETAPGATTAPPDITGLTATPINEYLLALSWSKSTSFTLATGASVIINHQEVLSGASWGNSTTLLQTDATQNNAIVPLLTGTYLLKYVTSGGIRSVLAATVTARTPSTTNTYIQSNISEEELDFPGIKTLLEYRAFYDGLILSATSNFDELALGGDFNSISDLDNAGEIAASGEYNFASPVDLGDIYSVNLVRKIEVNSINTAGSIDENYGNIDTWVNFDGGSNLSDSDYDAVLYARLSDNAPASNTWGDWFIVANNTVVGRSFEFKVVLSSKQANQNPILKKAGVIISLDQNCQTSGPVTSPSTIDEITGLIDDWTDFDNCLTYFVSYDKSFYTIPTVNITPFNLQSGDYFSISNVTTNGFSLDFFESSSTSVGRQFSYSAVGYGKRY
jgi:hypothetical protein